MNMDEIKNALAILNVIELQNKIVDSMQQFPEELQTDYEKERRAMGEVDEWPNATGDFGRCKTNPILVNETWGEITYLSRLVTEDGGKRMIFHRLGTVGEGIDLFELVSEDGKIYERFFVDMYHRHCSKKAPSGYKLLETLDGVTGSCEYDADFPENAIAMIAIIASNHFGAPIVSPVLKNFDSKKAVETVSENRQKNNPDEHVFSRFTI